MAALGEVDRQGKTDRPGTDDHDRMVRAVEKVLIGGPAIGKSEGLDLGAGSVERRGSVAGFGGHRDINQLGG